jgi:hypothetical protein
VRVLLDECVPRPLRRELPGHDVRAVTEMGWSGRKNGELLRLAASHGFDVFLTVDQNLPHKQDLREASMSIVVLVARTNRLDELIGLMPSVRATLDTARPGEVVVVRLSA